MRVSFGSKKHTVNSDNLDAFDGVYRKKANP